MAPPHAIADPKCPPIRRRAAFTLVELLVVMGIIVVLLALAVPAFTSMRSGSDFIAAASDIGSTLEQARAYAMANNTYVYVGLGEYVATEATSVSPRSPGIGQVVVAIVASRDGTRGYDLYNPTGNATTVALSASGLTAIDKLHFYNNVHVSDFGNNPPTSGKMMRPAFATDAQYTQYCLGNASSQSITTLSWPLGGSQYTFNKVIQIDPQGVARMQTSSNTDSISAFMEIDLQPTHGTTAPAAPGDLAAQNVGNQAALRLDCMTGTTHVFHP